MLLGSFFKAFHQKNYQLNLATYFTFYFSISNYRKSVMNCSRPNLLSNRCLVLVQRESLFLLGVTCLHILVTLPKSDRFICGYNIGQRHIRDQYNNITRSQEYNPTKFVLITFITIVILFIINSKSDSSVAIK